MTVHYTHKTRSSFGSSLYDEVCLLCGATDASSDYRLKQPCPAIRNPILKTTGGWEYDKMKWDCWCSLSPEEAKGMDLEDLSDLACSGPPALPGKEEGK